MARIFGAADIGSNTVHLLVAASDGELVTRVDKFNEWISLGEMVARKGEIPKESQQQLIMALKEVKRLATDRRCERLYVFGTEALRSARNSKEVLARIGKETGILVDLISGRTEAELSVRGMTLDTRHVGVDAMFEVGGGSVQVATIERNILTETESLPLGTGRVIAEAGLQSPCSPFALKAAANYIDSVLEKSQLSGKIEVAVIAGGVARGLWRALHPDGEKTLAMEELDYLIWSCRRLTTERIIERYSVKPLRATTLLPGALVYRALMKRFGVDEVLVTEFGIREGAILQMASV